MADLGNISKIQLVNGDVAHFQDLVSGYTKNTGTITGIKMNGSSKGTSGVVDLGTVITAHQDISGKADKSATVSTIAWDSTNNKLTKTINGSTTDVVTIATIKSALALPDPMVFKGSLGTGGTITSLPTAAASNKGYTYKVITAGTYASQAAKVGDTFISDGSSWVLIPSGDEPSGTVTSVGIQSANNNTISVSGSPITSSGTITLGLKLGYTTSGNNRAVQADSNGNLYVVQKDDNTNYYHTTGSWSGLTYTATANGGAGALAFTIPTGTTSTTVAVGNHTHSLAIASDSGTNQLTLLSNTKYKLTAGGNSYIFTTPSSNNTYFVKGTQTATTNVWTGELPTGVTAYYDGLSIDYFLPYKGNSTAATLNLGNLGAKPVYVGASVTGATTHYAQYSVIHLTYVIDSNLNSGEGCWKATGYYDTNTKNTTGTTNKIDTKLFLAGAASQGSNPQTYSNVNVYIGTDNCLYSNGEKVSTATATQNATTGITASTTATKTTLGTAFTIPNVTSAGSASTWAFEDIACDDITSWSAGSGSASISGAVDGTDSSQLNITISHTHTAPTLNYTARTVSSKKSGANSTAPTLGTAFTVPNVTGNTSATVSITDGGHTHTI